MLQILQYRLNAIVVGQQALRSLLPDARYAGDVIGTVAHQRLEVHKLPGCDAVSVTKAFLIILSSLGDAASSDQNCDPVTEQLQQVAITGDDDHLAALSGPAICQRADDVVGLIARFFEHLQAKRLYYLVDYRVL